jgi:hypothetical protein
MHKRNIALARAQRFRTCPPPDMAADPSQEQNYRRHLAICPFCVERGAQEADHALAWQKLADALAERLPSQPEGGSPVRRPKAGLPVPWPQTGQLRRLRAELGRWREGFYYTPPCVLVVDAGFSISPDASHLEPPAGDAPAERSDAIWVAQTYHDITLAAPGDLILTAEQTGSEELLVECWNTYTLKVNDLGPVEGTVSPEIIAAVRKLAPVCVQRTGRADPEAEGHDWIRVPRPLMDNDPRIYFRELEVEVGYTFAAVAASKLMAALEQPALELNYPSADDLKTDMGKILPGIAWPKAARSLDQILTAAMVPPEYYSLAASPEPGQLHLLKLISLDAGRVRAVDFGQAHIIMQKVRSGSLTISGRVLEPTTYRRGSRLLCFLETDESILRAPDRLSWDPVDQTLVATFSNLPRTEAKLHLAVLYDANDV